VSADGHVRRRLRDLGAGLAIIGMCVLALEFPAATLPLLGVAAVLGALVVIPRWGTVTRRAEGIGAVELVKGPGGWVGAARGEVAGRPVRIYPDRIEVEVPTGEPARLGPDELRALARAFPVGEDDGRGEAAVALRAAGVQEVRAADGRLVVRSRRGRARDLVPAALRVTGLGAVRAAVAGAQETCPYCHDGLGSLLEAPTLRCTGCDSLHHVECWREHGGCALQGCRRAPRRDAAATPPGAPASDRRPAPLKKEKVPD